MVLRVRSSGHTDVGRRRRRNEDALFHDDALKLYVVADGMGGHAAGEVASAEAVAATVEMVREGRASLEAADESPPTDALTAARRLMEAAVQSATYLVHEMGAVDAGKHGMCSTLSAAMIVGDSLVIGHVGDSRIYLIRNGDAQPLTDDHTLVAWQLRQGLITEAEARYSPHRNVITRSIGGRDHVEVDTRIVPLRPGDRILLCSDGLYGHVADLELAELVSLGAQDAPQGLVELANERGGTDNITCVVIEVD